MNTKIPVVQDRDERHRAERLEASFIHALRVLVLALYLERGRVGHAATVLIATEEEESVWIPDFQSPEVEQTLQTDDPDQ